MAPEPFDLERDKRWQMKSHEQRVCRTSGCFTYVLTKKDRYCLACQLDRGIRQPPEPREWHPRTREPHA